MGASNSPWIYVYDTTTTPYTKLSDPANLAAGAIKGISWSSDGTILNCVFAQQSPYIIIYDTTTTPYSKLANPDAIPLGAATSCALRPDGTRFVITGLLAATALWLYDTSSGAPYTQLPGPSMYPAGYQNGSAWSPDGTRLALATNNAPYYCVYCFGQAVACKAQNKVDTTMGGSYGYAKSSVLSGYTGTAAKLFEP